MCYYGVITRTNECVKFTKGTVILNIKLKNAREKTGLTQVEVAEKAKISSRAYQQYEAGKRVPNAYTAILIANAVHSKVEKLFTPTEYHEPRKKTSKTNEPRGDEL